MLTWCWFPVLLQFLVLINGAAASQFLESASSDVIQRRLPEVEGVQWQHLRANAALIVLCPAIQGGNLQHYTFALNLVAVAVMIFFVSKAWFLTVRALKEHKKT